MATTTRGSRARAFGEQYTPTRVDRLGIWLSMVQIRRRVPSFAGLRVADLGCGFEARFARTVLTKASHVTLVDVSLAEPLLADPRLTAIVGALPKALEGIPDASLDVVICNSVIEHLWEPQETLEHINRILVPGGTGLVNVPSWRGKWFLELTAFRLGLGAAEEMDDHKAYYDPRDLWPMLVRAGFRPRDIRCFTHKLTLNTFAVCGKAGQAEVSA